MPRFEHVEALRAAFETCVVVVRVACSDPIRVLPVGEGADG